MLIFWQLPAWLNFIVATAAAVILVIIASVIFALIIRVIGRGHDWAVMLRKRTRWPLIVLLFVIALWAITVSTLPLQELRAVVNHIFLIIVVLAVAWFIGSLLVYFVDLGLVRYATDGSDGWQARRARTQFQVLRRLTVAVTVVVAVGAALLTFPGANAIGAAVLGSAGLLSVVAGLAAQSTLGNVFAGMQLAFSGAVRLEDIVVVDGEWGYIEELTLTYVVVRIWDERRLVLPSTYFTQQPYENWTRHSTAVLGTVYFDLDWGVDVVKMRDELDRVLKESHLWDGEASSLRVTDAIGGFVQVRALVSAADAFSMFDLCRTVREEMLLWLQKQNPGGIPRTRIQSIDRDGESFPRMRASRRSNTQDATGSTPSRGDETPPPEPSSSPPEDQPTTESS